MRKVKTCRFDAAKWFWPSIFVHFAEAGKCHTLAVDWLDSLIGPGGSLLIPFHPFFSVSFMGIFGKFCKQAKLGCHKYIFRVTN
jgi:hypothetical protein